MVLSGSQLMFAFTEGSQAVIRQRDLINRMNVYPVPDGDTGSNLSFTLKSGMDNAQGHDSFGQTLRNIAEQLLLGAKGNSGLLFAQFMNGWADAIGEDNRVGTETFVAGVRKAVASTYASIATPVEGTILTVMREWSEHLENLRDRHGDLLSLLDSGMEHVKESLHRTRDKLEVLRKANTDDAGARGFVEFLGGFVSGLRSHGDAVSRGLVPTHEATPTGSEKEDDDIHAFDLDGGLASVPFRYCTECMVSGSDLSPARIREALSTFGDSLIAAGSMRTVRIHIHTNNPPEVFSHLSGLGTVGGQKVEDMHLQYLITHRQHGSGRVATGILTDTTCDLPDELALKHRIVMIPLSVNFGDQYWLDRYALDSATFFRLMEEGKEFPKTSQPSPALFRRTYQFLLSHYDHIIANHISEGLSGTSRNSLNEAQAVSPDRITVAPSRITSTALGLCLVRTATDLESGMGHAEATARLENYQRDARFAVVVPRLDNFVRGGRIPASKARLANLLHLKPLVTTDAEGKAGDWGKGFGFGGAKRLVLRRIRESLAKGPIHSWAISHGEAAGEAEAMARRVEKLIGKPPLFITPLSPVLGTHGGRGALNIAWLPE